MIKLLNLTLKDGIRITEKAEFNSEMNRIVIQVYDINIKINKNVTIYAYDENLIPYTFFHCSLIQNNFDDIFVVNNKEVKLIHIFGNYYSGAKLESDNFLSKHIQVNLTYDKRITEASIISQDIIYDANVKISIITEDDCFLINVISDIATNHQLLRKIFFNYYEMFILAFSSFPCINKILYCNGSEYIQELFPLASKYIDANKSRLNLPILFNMQIIEGNNIEKWMTFRKKADLSFDVFMVTCSADLYIELRLSLFLQCIEGICKSAFQMDGEYWEILHRLFIQDPNVSTVFSSDDIVVKSVCFKDSKTGEKKERQEETILYRAKKHRNYYSHFNIRKDVFQGSECIYALEKLMLGFRIKLCEELEIKYDQSRVDYIRDVIDKWKKKIE